MAFNDNDWCCCYRLTTIGYSPDPHLLRRRYNEVSHTWSYECIHCNTLWLTWQSRWVEDTDYIWVDS